jgi:hypothetical protein
MENEPVLYCVICRKSIPWPHGQDSPCPHCGSTCDPERVAAAPDRPTLTAEQVQQVIDSFSGNDHNPLALELAVSHKDVLARAVSAEAALAFYANKDLWRETVHTSMGVAHYGGAPAMMDRGKVARAALATVEGGAAGTMADARHDAASPCAASGVSDTREGGRQAFVGERVREFATAWEWLPEEVRDALVTIRSYEEEGAYRTSLLRDAVRGYMRQSGGADAVGTASPVPAVADDPDQYDLCGECGAISPTAQWQALDADPLDADGHGLRIVVAKGHEPSFWECPACRYLHRDDDADPGVWSGTREQMEAERASLVADGQEFVAGPGSRDTKEPGA